MTQKSPWWKLFWSNKSKYLSNRSYLNAWCCKCLDAHVRGNMHADELSIARGDLIKAHGYQELWALTMAPRGSVLPGIEPAPAMHWLSVRVQPIKGTWRVMQAHASGCPYTPAELLREVEARLLEENKENQPLGLTIPSMEWVPGSKVSDHRMLSGRYLDRAVAEVEARTKVTVEGKVVTGQCDGWKNIAKMPIVTSVMTVEHEAYLLRTHNMTGEPKMGEKLLEIVISDISYMSNKFGVKTIGWCTDDGPNGKKMHQLLSVLMAWITCLVCWSHQINLVVGEYLTIPEILEVITQALEIVKWFNSHGVALDLLDKEQELTYINRTQTLALILPRITHWTAHFLAISRLLDVSVAMKLCCTWNADKLLICAGRTADVKAKAQSILDVVKDEGFWKKLIWYVSPSLCEHNRIRTHLEPLAIAANITQAPHTRLDHVLLTLGNLYCIYCSADTESNVREKILGSLEKRWKKADQDVFILAIFLNPYIRGRCFNCAALTQSALFEMVKLTFMRVFGQAPTNDFVSGLIDYSRAKDIFTDGLIQLDYTKETADKVSKDIDLVLLCIIANSASCEWAFCEFGIGHMKLRNHLDCHKTHGTAAVKMDIHRSHVSCGLTSTRKKCKFSEDYPGQALESPSQFGEIPISLSAAPDSSSDVLEGGSFRELAEQLQADAIAARDDNEGPLILSSAGSLTEAPRSSRKTAILLHELFIFPPPGGSEAGLDFYWHGGMRNYDEELAQYELIHSLSQSDTSNT
ncbi:ribonuclease H-like domain-containing protein [Sparassis latifolia]